MPEEKGRRQKSPQILPPKEEPEPRSPSERPEPEHPTEVVHETISFARAIFNLPPHPFQGVMNAEHLTKLIEYEEKNEQRAFEDAKQLRKHTTWRLIILSLLFVFVVTFVGLANPTMLVQVLEGLALFVSGVGAGLGVKSYLDRKKD